MSEILVVGSVALDSVETPFGKADSVLGGSATYFSVAASFFTPPQLVAVVGEDFPEEHLDLLRKHKVDLRGLSQVSGRTFRWAGSYGYDLNVANTLATELNVFEAFRPAIPPELKSSDVLFLANIDPDLQLDVLRQIDRPKVVACDTMNFWISSKRESLREVFSSVDIVFMNDAETREFAGESNLIKAARKILALGPRYVAVKRGEYGSMLFGEGGVFAAPAFPLEEVFDPTGAGDTFAGGFMGYLAHTGTFDSQTLRKAVAFGSVMASFTVEDFSLRRLSRLTHPEIQERMQSYRRMLELEMP
jgi:sugar/nucleoside kinase (ribokinase family)